nr:hypothetical protein [uncultured Methanoregula sp.]
MTKEVCTIKAFFVIGTIIAAIMIMLIGTHLGATSEDTRCISCQPFAGMANQNGSNLELTILGVNCTPVSCYPCNINPDGQAYLNLSIASDGNNPVSFENRAVRINETIIVPGVLTDSPQDQVSAWIVYNGTKNTSCRLKVVETHI